MSSVTDGLSQGDMVIVQGLTNVRPGRAGRRLSRPERELNGMISAVFVDRPRLAIVIAIVTTIAGLLALLSIPLAQYPDIVPPQVSVTTLYPGARARWWNHRRPADRSAGRRCRQDDLHEERERR